MSVCWPNFQWLILLILRTLCNIFNLLHLCFLWQVKIVKCLVQNTIIDISFNQLGGLSALCFLEQVVKETAPLFFVPFMCKNIVIHCSFNALIMSLLFVTAFSSNTTTYDMHRHALIFVRVCLCEKEVRQNSKVGVSSFNDDLWRFPSFQQIVES